MRYTLENVKKQTKTLHTELNALLGDDENKIKLAACYELIFHMHGYKDWNTFCASLPKEYMGDL